MYNAPFTSLDSLNPPRTPLEVYMDTPVLYKRTWKHNKVNDWLKVTHLLAGTGHRALNVTPSHHTPPAFFSVPNL